MLLIFTAGAYVFGQQSVGQNPKREVIFTMNPNEVIFQDEYFAYNYFGQNRFACILRDTITDKYTFVFNGKRVLSSTEMIGVNYLNLNETNGYAVHYYSNGVDYNNITLNIRGTVYENVDDWYADENYENISYTTEKQDGYYMHYRGMTDGPFEKIEFNKDYDYTYLLAGKWWGHRNGKNELMPEDTSNKIYTAYEDGKYYLYVNGTKSQAYDSYIHLYTTKSGKYAYTYENSTNKKNERTYVNINGTETIIYGNILDLILNESGKYLYSYRENGKWYININGSVSQSYDDVGRLYLLTESGKYAYTYTKNQKIYVNINGNTVSGGYSLVWSLLLAESGKYAYYHQINGGKYCVNINGIVSQSYDGVSDLYLTKSGKYAYIYQNNGKWYVNINGIVSQGYDEITNDNGYLFHLYESGKYAYVYQNNGKEYLNINGIVSQGFDKIRTGAIGIVNGLNLTESGRYAYIYQNNGKWYVNIDGIVSQGYDEVRYLLNLSKGRKYAYCYQNNGKWYANINGKIYGAYNAVGGAYIEDNGDFSFTYNLNGVQYEKTNIGEDPVWLGVDVSTLELYSTDKKHMFYSDYRYEYVVIDGKRYGTAPATQVKYDKDENTFIWNAVEGREFVVYEYRLY